MPSKGKKSGKAAAAAATERADDAEPAEPVVEEKKRTDKTSKSSAPPTADCIQQVEAPSVSVPSPSEAPATGPAGGPRRILFVGDSLTYVNDLEKKVAEFAAAAGIGEVVCDREVEGGAPLKTLYNNTDAKKRIAEGNYDIVVLQEDLPETEVSIFKDYAARFDRICKAAGSKVVLFAPWSYKRLGWISTEGIHKAHEEVAAKLGARVAPVGLAWKRAQELRVINFFQKDKEHPNFRGTYLAAAVIFSIIWRRTPVGVDYKPGGTVTEEEVAFLQSVAWETVAKKVAADDP